MELQAWTAELLRAFSETMDAIRDRNLAGFDADDLRDAAVQIYLKRQGMPDQLTVALFERAARATIQAEQARGNLPSQNMYLVVCLAYNACAMAATRISAQTFQESMAGAQTMALQLESGRKPAAAPPPRPAPSTIEGFFENIRSAWIKSRTMQAIHTHDDHIFKVAPHDEVGLALIHSFGERGFGQNPEDFRFLLGQLHDAVRVDLAGLDAAASGMPFLRFAICFIRFHAQVAWLPERRARTMISAVLGGRCKAPR